MGVQTYDAEALSITPRDVQFDWDDLPLHYVEGQPIATHITNVMHITLPEGERAMVQALSDALPLVKDERLRDEMIGFIGQEEIHSSSHEDLHVYLDKHGLDVGPIVGKLEWLVDRVFNRPGLRGRAKHAWLCERLALSAALEHYTAVMGEWVLDADGLDKAMHPMMLDLVRWHGAEEVEHRNVAFDAYMYVDGSYFRRARTGVMASFLLLVIFAWATTHLYRNDPTRSEQRFWLFQLVDAARRGLIPSGAHFITEVPVYLRRDFHPSQMGPIDKALRYLARSPAAQAAAS
ncbi:metal-dependent hydrolase [Svornostia abyssi]|uniref:metal-dependent hydrolase n=1 Tax=Svornostia abyssi TaxID=2898438 RepID=UPI0038640BB4